MRAPDGLAPATKRWWLSVTRDWQLEEHHIRLLTMAAQAWDRAQAAQTVIAEHGMTYEDRFGAPRLRPEVNVRRDAEVAFARLIRELDLDIEPPAEATRPPVLRRYYATKT